MVDLYYALYGSKRPLCLQSAEMNSMYKDFVREGAIKKSSTTVSKTPPPPEIKPEVIRNDDTDEVLEQKTVTNTLKRTATEAFAVEDEIIKLETNEEIAVVNEIIKDEIYETETITVSKVEVTSTTLSTETESFGSESKKLKSEVVDEDENSITIIDVSESTVTRMDSSFDSVKADSDIKHKMDASSKVSFI